MASFRLKFSPSAVEGREGTLYFQIIHRRVTRTVVTDCRIMPEEWNSSTSSITVAGPPERQAQLRLTLSKIQWDKRQLATIITEKEVSQVEYSVEDIVEAYRMLPPCQTLFVFINGMIAKKTRVGRLGTAKTYRDVLASFSRFRGGEDIAVDALDAETISLYEAWLRGRGLKRNSSSCYLRTLRTLYRKAAEAGLTTDRHIFSHVFTGFAKTSKRAIPLAAIRAIRQLCLTDGSSLALARDMFICVSIFREYPSSTWLT